jgi:Class III cytochrome C family
MTRSIRPLTIVLLVLGAAACFRGHPSTDTAVESEQCVTCHLPDYEGTTQPVHQGNYPQTCANCHTTSAWQPALDGNHPDGAFPISHGPHTGIECMSCHDPDLGPSAGGANTNCIQCHTQGETDPDHGGVSGYHFDASQPHFCLSCHPDGLGGAGHPENKFPITSGPHRGIACDQCHKASLGTPSSIDNTDCVTCHTGAHHRDPSKPHDCLRCHPNGYAGD